MALTYREEFIRFMVDSGVLRFGEFTLKSGRRAPYFINTGNYKTGAQLARLAAIMPTACTSTPLGGRAGRPRVQRDPGSPFPPPSRCGKNTASISAIASTARRRRITAEGGLFVGEQLADGERVLIVEDVMTSGKALREILPKLRAAADVKVAGMIISVDRMERGQDSGLSAVQEARREFGVEVYSIVTMADIISAIERGVVGREGVSSRDVRISQDLRRRINFL